MLRRAAHALMLGVVLTAFVIWEGVYMIAALIINEIAGFRARRRIRRRLKHLWESYDE